MRIGETRDVLEIPMLEAVLEIPWDRLRSVADPDFRAHLAGQAEKRLRRLGGRIRAMRLQAGLTRIVLAERIGISREELTAVENGKAEIGAERMTQIASALGKRLRDFSEP